MPFECEYPSNFGRWTVPAIQQLADVVRNEAVNKTPLSPKHRIALEGLQKPCGNLVHELTDEQLLNESNRRVVLKAFQRNLERRLQRAKLLNSMTKAVVDALEPEHNRSSCNDAELNNGWESNGADSPPRCTRCALLEILRGDPIPNGFKLSIRIDKEE